MNGTTFNRRRFLKSAAALAAPVLSTLRHSGFAYPEKQTHTMIPRPDLLPRDAPEGVEVFQLSDDPASMGHIYMEAQIFTPDSRRLVLRRAAFSHDGDRYNPAHCHMLCDLENNGELSPLTRELGVAGPCVSPDGKFFYYFVADEAGTRVELKRVNLDGTGRETVHVLDGAIPGTSHRASNLYPLSTLSSDGKRLAMPVFLGDGETENAPFGLLVYDLEKAALNLILEGTSWSNLHPQYCRSQDPAACHDIMIQENHGAEYDRKGVHLPGKLVGGQGADIHLVRDDGTDFRDFPCGRDVTRETCQGHQCWRGRGETAVIGTEGPPREGKGAKMELVEARAAPSAGHKGIHTPEAWRNDLSRGFEDPRFCHFGVDTNGRRILSDYPAHDGRWLLYAAEFGTGEDDPLANWRFVLDARSTKPAHPHPFLSPDGTKGFFNSDETGIIQPYMVTGLWNDATQSRDDG